MPRWQWKANLSSSFFSQSPAHSYSSYDSGKNESVGGCGEDLSLNRGDDDEDDHDDHEDVEKATEADGVEAERLKAFNVRNQNGWNIIILKSMGRFEGIFF